jgi:hypothetical protein
LFAQDDSNSSVIPLEQFKEENQCSNIKNLIPKNVNEQTLQQHKHQIYQNIIRNASCPLIYATDLGDSELYGQNQKRVHNQTLYSTEEISCGKSSHKRLKIEGKLGEDVDVLDIIAFEAQQKKHGETQESMDYIENKYMKSEVIDGKRVFKFATCHIIPHHKEGSYDSVNVRIGNYELNGIISGRVDPVLIEKDGKLDFSESTYEAFQKMNPDNKIPFFRLDDYIFSSNKSPTTNSHAFHIDELTSTAKNLINNAPKAKIDEWKLQHLKINPNTAKEYRAIITLAEIALGKF